jgi:lipoprotein-releasing system ATP-binding protein
MTALISLKNVTKDYVMDEETVITPVHEVNMDIEPGEFVIIIGRSGSGKTTLLNLAAGLVRPSSGEATIDNTNLWNIPHAQQSQLRNKKMGFVFQYPSLLASLTAIENVAMPAYLGRRNGVDPFERAGELLKTMGLSHRMKAYPKQLSSGEQRRVVIARALMNKPEILLADEPTSDLDTLTEKEMMSLFAGQHKAGVTILMVTHALDLIPYADRVMKMENGVLEPFTAN